MPPKFKDFLKRWLITTVAVLVTTHIPMVGISYDTKHWWSLILATFILGILNAILRPILIVLALPLVILTLGLFMIVINAVLLYLVGFLLPHFHVDGFWSAILGAISIGLISMVLNTLTGSRSDRSRIVVKRRIRVEKRRRKDDDDDDRNNPVIDV